MSRFIKRYFVSILTVGLIAGAFFAWSQQTAIYDWYRLRNYIPAPEIVALADATRMTEVGRRHFYVQHPELNSREDFNKNCTDSEFSIVLGCYVQGIGIYIYDVEDPRLNGIKEVTAAHEMLHVVYERLGNEEKNRLESQLTAVYEALPNEHRLHRVIELYRNKDPAVVPNELHSILGTEIADLTPELENHYARYFSDRKAVVAFSDQYEAVFTARKQKIAEYDSRLAQLQSQIDSLQSQIESQQQNLASERIRLDNLRSRGSVEEYNAAVPGYNALVQSYNTSVNNTQVLIDTFNTVVAQRNAIVVEENDLVRAIDSRPETIKLR
jgi:hypothetical protein